MSVYSAASYDPSIDRTLLFEGDPRISIVRDTFDVQKNYTRERFKIPGQAGNLDIGGTADGLIITMTLEIEDDDLEDFHTRFIALENALAGNGEGKFEFYLRYVDSDNFWKYTNCALSSIKEAEGVQDAKNTALNNRFDLTILSEDASASIKENGTLIVGTIDEQQSTNLLNTTSIYICDDLIVQNEIGEIKFRINAALQTMTVVGEINQIL